MRRFALVALVVFGCSKKDSSTGLPPAQEWGAEQGGVAHGGANNPHAVDPDNPHAGLGLNAQGEPEADDDSDPHAGLGADPTNPHAGLGADPTNPHAGLGADPTNPHAGMDGADVSKLGLPPPDPNRPIDPAHHVRGVITIDPKAAAHAQPGGAIFVIVKRADASGQPTGTPLAVDKLTWQKDRLPFEMTEAQAMIAGTQLVGDVIVTARYDQDGDALSKQPGDVVGQVRVTVPAENVKLVLDHVLGDGVH